MEKLNPGLTLREAIDEAQSQRDLLEITDPYERANALADYVRKTYPFAWTLKSMQDEAAKAVGVPSNKELEAMAAEEDEVADSRRHEVERLGYSLMGGAALCMMGELWSGAAGLAVLGGSIIAYSKTLDNDE